VASHHLPVVPRHIVDATILHAPSSTKNRDQQRDPEMHQTRKGKDWYFGMKAHVGVYQPLAGESHGTEFSASMDSSNHLITIDLYQKFNN